MIHANTRSTCLSCGLVWGAWYLQSRLTRCRRTVLRRGPFRTSLACTGFPTPKAVSSMSERRKVFAPD
jgi:hypothetical protein